MKRVEITGWKDGFLPITFIKLLRQSGKRGVSPHISPSYRVAGK